jgi:hypothetical protein
MIILKKKITTPPLHGIIFSAVVSFFSAVRFQHMCVPLNYVRLGTYRTFENSLHVRARIHVHAHPDTSVARPERRSRESRQRSSTLYMYIYIYIYYIIYHNIYIIILYIYAYIFIQYIHAALATDFREAEQAQQT